MVFYVLQAASGAAAAVDDAVPRCLQPVELLVHLEGSGAQTSSWRISFDTGCGCDRAGSRPGLNLPTDLTFVTTRLCFFQVGGRQTKRPLRKRRQRWAASWRRRWALALAPGRLLPRSLSMCCQMVSPSACSCGPPGTCHADHSRALCDECHMPCMQGILSLCIRLLATPTKHM